MDWNNEVEDDSASLASQMSAFESTVRGDYAIPSQATKHKTVSVPKFAETTAKSTFPSPKDGDQRFCAIAPRPSAQVSIPFATTDNLDTKPSQHRAENGPSVSRSSAESLGTSGFLDPRAFAQIGRKTTYISLDERQKILAGGGLQTSDVGQSLHQHVNGPFPILSAQSASVMQKPEPTLLNMPSRLPSQNGDIFDKLPRDPSVKRPTLPPQHSANKSFSALKIAEDMSILQPSVPGEVVRKTILQQKPPRLPRQPQLNSYTQPQPHLQPQFIQQQYPRPLAIVPSKKRKRPSKAKETSSIAVDPVEQNGQGKSKHPSLAAYQAQDAASVNALVMPAEKSRKLGTGSFSYAGSEYPLQLLELNAPLEIRPSLSNTSSISRKSSADINTESLQVAGFGYPPRTMAQDAIRDYRFSSPSQFQPYIQYPDIQSSSGIKINNNPFRSPSPGKSVAPYAPGFSNTSQARGPSSQDPFRSADSISMHTDSNGRLQHLNMPKEEYDNRYMGNINKMRSCRTRVTEEDVFSTSKSSGQQNPLTPPRLGLIDSDYGNRISTPKSAGKHRGYVNMHFPRYSGMTAKHFGVSEDVGREILAQHPDREVDAVFASTGSKSWVSGVMESGVARYHSGVSDGAGQEIPIDPRLYGITAGRSEGADQQIPIDPRLDGITAGRSEGADQQIPIDPRLDGITASTSDGSRFSGSMKFSSEQAIGNSALFGSTAQQVGVKCAENPRLGRNYSNRVVDYSKYPYHKERRNFLVFMSAHDPHLRNERSYGPLSNTDMNRTCSPDANLADLEKSSRVPTGLNQQHFGEFPDDNDNQHHGDEQNHHPYIKHTVKNIQVPKGLFSARPRMGIFYPTKPGQKAKRTVSWETLQRLTKKQEGQEQEQKTSGMRGAKVLEAARHLYPSLFDKDTSVNFFPCDDKTVQKLSRGDIGIENVVKSWERKAAKMNHQADILRLLQKVLPKVHENFKNGSPDVWVEMLRYFKAEGVAEPAPEDFVVYSQSWKVLNERKL